MHNGGIIYCLATENHDTNGDGKHDHTLKLEVDKYTKSNF